MMKMGAPHNFSPIQEPGLSVSEDAGTLFSVLSVSVMSMLVICLLSVIEPEWAKTIFIGARRWSVINLDWLLVSSANLLLIISLILAISPLGKRRLGSQPKEFSNIAWFSMVAFTGFGLTLVFWGVTEPVAFFTDWWGVPFNQTAQTENAAELALSASYYHWGLHPWAIYGMTALAIAHSHFVKSLPLSLSSAFYPILKQQPNSFCAKLIDSITVIATLLGVVTTLGLGARQAAKTLEHLYDIPNSLLSQSVIILVVSSILFVIMQRGLNKGIKRISLFNLILVGVFLAAFLILSEASGSARLVTNASLHYLKSFVALSEWSQRDDLKFFHGWTVFYWLWWFSWAPFIGLFIARISRGRSIRECVIGIIILPTILTYAWFSILGGTGLEQLLQGVSNIVEPRLSPSTAMFNMLSTMPLGQWLSATAILLVLLCFITTSDSSLYIIRKLTNRSNERHNGKKLPQFWLLLQTVLALSLLTFGGKKALESVQSASLLIGVLMSILLLLSSVCLILSLKQNKI